jgi:MFS family permease
MGLQQWVVDGYLLAMAAMALPGGFIAHLFGRVPVMRFGAGGRRHWIGPCRDRSGAQPALAGSG